jgi:sterol desaturase/sphingolipid hydroxylase (fatty acid hydroxylase superfamily)
MVEPREINVPASLANSLCSAIHHHPAEYRTLRFFVLDALCCRNIFKNFGDFLRIDTVRPIKRSSPWLTDEHLKSPNKEIAMGTILIIVLILLLIGGLPVFPHSRSWGYGPSGIIGTVLVILLILVLLGKI